MSDERLSYEAYRVRWAIERLAETSSEPITYGHIINYLEAHKMFNVASWYWWQVGIAREEDLRIPSAVAAHAQGAKA